VINLKASASKSLTILTQIVSKHQKMTKRILFIYLLFTALNSIAQISPFTLRDSLKNENLSIGMKLISLNGEYHLIRNEDLINCDTIPLKLKQYSFFDSTVVDTYILSVRILNDTTKKELIFEYNYRKGGFSFGSSGYTDVYILDYYSGNTLFKYRKSQHYIYGTNWTQGPESCGGRCDIIFKPNGNIIVENKVKNAGLGNMPQSKKGKIKYGKKMKTVPAPCFLPEFENQKIEIYVYNEGGYILKE